jgi:hypothetical protein
MMATMPAAARTALIIGCLLSTVSADAAFYRYRDAAGRYVYVDDLSKVPQAFKDSVREYAEPTDAMSETQRRAFEAKEARRQQRQRQRYLQHVRKITEKQESAPAQRPRPPNTTSVQVANNQVLVPVTLSYGGVDTQAVLLLDTGANVTVIHQEVADALGLRWPKRATMEVVGGRRIRAGIARLDRITLGTLHLDRIEVGIIRHQGAKLPYAGLLGMNVLGRVAFEIDLNNQEITWQHRSGQAVSP